MLLKVLHWNLSYLQYVLVADLRVFIEENQQEHLVRRSNKLVLLMEVAAQFSRTETEFPVNLSPIVEF